MTQTGAALPPWADPERFRLNNFDFLRFGFASLVILSHAWPLNGRGYTGEPGVLLLSMSLGELGVDGFFLISGFLIAASWQNSRGVGHFLAKRARRIYPGFLVAFAFSVLLVAPLGGASWQAILRPGHLAAEAFSAVTLGEPSARGTGAFDGLSHAALNGSMWTIRYEAGCYVLIALLGGLGLLVRRPLVVALFFGACAAAAAAKLSGWSPAARPLWRVVGWPQHWPYFLSFFLSGTLFYVLRRHIPCSAKLAAVAVAAALVAPRHPLTRTTLLPAALTYLTFWLAYTPRVRLRDFGRYGDFSYGIYLYAFPIQQLLILHVPPARSPWVNALLAWPLAILAGAASWHLVEKPLLSRRRKRLLESAPPTPVSTDRPVSDAA